ncbi:hypothetical protein FH972_014448 [Carpinus fangiana]|uniref:Phytocyanin domain-containing protein n=1 Tax=Carpinus fangiana TaxID=176857 RepID=A0A5N6RD87_9ROSI|nr:hypothetical protein FH972_014448 [Carpinus fangiana]
MTILMLRTLMSLTISATLINLAMAANYMVWRPKRWVAYNHQPADMGIISIIFIFQYAPNHDVLEVSKADYDSCQASNAIQSYNCGTTTIPLSSPGNRYFICGTMGHCSQGMKVEIDTLASSAAPPASSPSAEPPAGDTSGSYSSSRKYFCFLTNTGARIQSYNAPSITI